MVTAGSWLKEWDLLQRAVEPLVDVGRTRPPSAWTLGPAADAVAVALAFHHAWGDPSTAEIRVHLSDQLPSGELYFRLSDVRCVPASRLNAAFHQEDRHWVPNDRLTRRVVLCPPGQAVDLLTVRLGDTTAARRPTTAGSALGLVRQGGWVLFDVRPPAKVVAEAGLKPLERSTRLFERTGETTTRRVDVPEPGLVTLADRLQQAALVESHLNLARSLARRFNHYGDRDDLEQVAMIALVRAAGRFRPDRGFAFATFATASILGELKRHFRDKTWAMRVPRSVQETYLSVKRAHDELSQTLGASPTVGQIASHLGISDEAVLTAMEAGDNYSPVSLDLGGRDGEGPNLDPGFDDERFDRALNRRQLELALPELNEMEQLLIRRLYFDGQTQKDVAAEIGVSQMQISRLATRTLTKLRARFEVEG